MLSALWKFEPTKFFIRYRSRDSRTRNFTCCQCHKKFMRDSSRRIHEKRHLPRTMRCQYCHHTDYNASNFRTHMRRKHPNIDRQILSDKLDGQPNSNSSPVRFETTSEISRSDRDATYEHDEGGL